MNKLKRIIYVICAMLIFIVILLLLVVHTFNHTEVNNDSGTVYVKPLKGIGCEVFLNIKFMNEKLAIILIISTLKRTREHTLVFF